MKYTFEIMKEYEEAFRGISVYSVSEDKKLMVDFVALEELEDAQKEIDEAYQRGLDDTWEAAKKLFSSMADSDIEKAFPIEWNNGGFKALMDLKPQEAINKIKAYEEQKADEEVKVGDEVDWSGDRFIVTRIYKLFGYKNHCDGIGKNGCVYNDILVESLVKTGRTFPLVASIVEEMTK